MRNNRPLWVNLDFKQPKCRVWTGLQKWEGVVQANNRAGEHRGQGKIWRLKMASSYAPTNCQAPGRGWAIFTVREAPWKPRKPKTRSNQVGQRQPTNVFCGDEF